MGYWWAILIITLSLFVLYNLGLLNGSSVPRAQPGACQVYRPSGAYTTFYIALLGTCNGRLPQYTGLFSGASGYASFSGSLAEPSGCNATITLWAQYAGGSNPVTKTAVNFATPNNNLVIFYQVTSSSSGYYSFTVGPSSNRGTVSGLPAVGASNWTFYALNVSFSRLASGSQTFSGAQSSFANLQAFGYHRGGAGGSPCSANAFNMTLSEPITANAFFGQIANVQIYNTSLTNAQATALFKEGLGGAPLLLSNLVAWYPLNSDTKDYSGDNLPAVNNGMSYSTNLNGYKQP